LIEETNAAGVVVARYTQTETMDEPLAMLRSRTTSYYEQDGNNSVTSLSSTASLLAYHDESERSGPYRFYPGILVSAWASFEAFVRIYSADTTQPQGEKLPEASARPT
jgi:hypothetical protein